MKTPEGRRSARRGFPATCIATLWIASAPTPCAQEGEPAPEDLALRVERLEAELVELRDRPGFGVGSDLWAELYGYVKFDAAYDSARVSTGDFARWVASEATSDDDDQLSLTMRQTRLGLRIGDDGAPMCTDARVEIDFYGGTLENKPEPMLRHAYLQACWPERGLELLAGQTSDVISPLCAPTVNYTVLWWQGNVGYRRPQVRATRRLALGEETELELQLAFARTITNLQTTFTSPDVDTGADSGVPTVQSRVAIGVPCGSQRAALGVSGHYGKEEQDLDMMGGTDDFRSWSVNLDASVPLGERLRLQAELFQGTNLDAYLGGVGQGFDVGSGDTVDAYGGWCAGTWAFAEGWGASLGYGVDVADADDLSAALARTRNEVLFANAHRDVGRHLRLAVELARLDTEYLDSADGDGYRVQVAATYSF